MFAIFSIDYKFVFDLLDIAICFDNAVEYIIEREKKFNNININILHLTLPLNKTDEDIIEDNWNNDLYLPKQIIILSGSRKYLYDNSNETISTYLIEEIIPIDEEITIIIK
jgi:hypothetical protein